MSLRADLDQFVRDWKMLLDSRDAASKAGAGSVVRQSFAHSINTSFPASLKLPKPPVEPEPPEQPTQPIIHCPDSPTVQNEAYSSFIVFSGDASTYEILDGSLPDGLSLDMSTGEISGTPTVCDTFDFTVRVTDTDDVTHDKECSIEVTCVVGACCLPDSTCEQMSESDCTGAGGVYQGDGVSCDDVECCIIATNAPSSVSFSGTISGSFTSSPDNGCDSQSVTISADIEESTQGLDPGACVPPDNVVAEIAIDAARIYDCPEGECAASYDTGGDFVFDCKLSYVAGDWSIQFSVVYESELCGADHTNFFTYVIMDMSIGADPTGSHSFTISDPNISGITYDLEVDIS